MAEPFKPFCTGPLGTWERGTCSEAPITCETHRECVICTNTALYCGLHSPDNKCSTDGCKNEVNIRFCGTHFEEVIAIPCQREHGKMQPEADYVLCEMHYLESMLEFVRKSQPQIPNPPAFPAASGIPVSGKGTQIYDPSVYGAAVPTFRVAKEPVPVAMCESMGHTEATRFHCDDCFDIEVRRQVLKVLEGYGIAVQL